MSRINHLTVLAFAAGAVAVPNYGHSHLHSTGEGTASGTGASYPSPTENATSVWGTASAACAGSTITSWATKWLTVTASASDSISTISASSFFVNDSSPAGPTATASATWSSSTGGSYATPSPLAPADKAHPSPDFAGNGGGKRGLSYNDASVLQGFLSSPNIGFAYNWGQEPNGFTPTDKINYVPTLWGNTPDYTNAWVANANAALAHGSKYIFSFNEPDLGSQSNITPEAAAASYKQWIQPFAGRAKLCAPAVTNGGGALGLSWLKAFLDACTGCTIDAVNIHWYAPASTTEYFKQQVTNATTISGKPVLVTEFAPTDGSDADKENFLKTVMPWMDSNPNVLGYAYFGVFDGLLLSGRNPSAIGEVYSNYKA